jgi:transitional endoplasmic reticulum ATPase
MSRAIAEAPVQEGQSPTAESIRKTEEARVKLEILSTLDRLGGLTVQADGLTFEGERFVIPSRFAGSVHSVIEYLKEYQESQETEYEYVRRFAYRPWDGAAAFDRAVKRVTGSAGIGRATFSFFGPKPPQQVTITTGLNQTTQVSWGQVEVPMLEATFHLGSDHTPDGIVFAIHVSAPRKHKQRVAAFLDVVADELATRSIYRGQAFTGGDEPEFLNLNTVDAESVVYGRQVMTELGANLWTLLEHPDTMRALRIPLKRTVLVEGPPGTGKTLAGQLTGQIATAHGWTYVLCRPGIDSIESTMSLARMYAPAVVWVEDIETTAGGSPEYLSKLLETFDGVTAKGHEVIVGMTTNHVDRIPQKMLRPGRIDSVIHIGELTADSVRKLVEITVSPELLDPDIAWDRVAYAFTEPTAYVPAFGREAISRALRYAMARSGGNVVPITTDDLVDAANGLRAQHTLMSEASEGIRVETGLEAALGTVIGRAVVDVTERTIAVPDVSSDRSIVKAGRKG